MSHRRRAGGKRGKRSGRKDGGSKEQRRAEHERKAQQAAVDEFAMPETEVIVPEDQLKLTPEQLDEELTKALTAEDPNVAANHVVFHWREFAYKDGHTGHSGHVKIHFSMDGSICHVDSDEAKQQKADAQAKEDALEERQRALIARALEAGEDPASVAPAKMVGKNQFNYSDRAAQTFNHTRKDRLVSTQPPQTRQFGATVSKWAVYDAYVEEWESQQRAAELMAQAQASRKSRSAPTAIAPPPPQGKGDVIHSEEMGRALRVLERMVNQNAQDEIYSDFKYWEDPSDEFRDGEGTLLPLWRFADHRARRKQVTALCWNPSHNDLFAVGYGSYDFLKQGMGLINVFTLKNTKHPEYSFSTESGVMCLDFHPQHAALLAVGCYDGTVRVFDVRRKENKHIFMSSIKTGKHTDPVWQVKWQAEDLAKDMNFFSISSDGRVANWIMSKNELKMEPVMMLKLAGSSSGAEVDEETSLTGLAGGCCFDFNRKAEHLFIVGTEEGKIHKCSKAYSGQYLETYEGHNMAVYSVKWNTYHPRVFLSSSADWTVKMWDHNITKPIMSWDLSCAVGDVCWAPYSSTVFAAVTSDGKVHIYDLAANKHEQFCEQKVVKRAHLTHVLFNSREPVLLVGDNRGGVNSLKLSPNLRRVEPITVPEPQKGQSRRLPPTRRYVEVAKMDRLLASTDFKIEPTATAELAAAGEDGAVVEGDEPADTGKKRNRRRG